MEYLKQTNKQTEEYLGENWNREMFNDTQNFWVYVKKKNRGLDVRDKPGKELVNALNCWNVMEKEKQWVRERREKVKQTGRGKCC